MVIKQKKKRRLTPAVGVTIPQNVQDETNRLFVEAIDRDTFFGKVSMSKVITALLEIAVERAAAFDSSKVTGTESLKAELERMLQR
ncbi:hypothetical protein AO955_20735 [Pseudomonas aeruginosa]|nr:hypothetical protein AO955_20735 [Pseudomonas aeruginosa]